MINFFLGMATMYFGVNIIVMGIILAIEWDNKKNWKVKRFPLMVLFGIPMMIAETFMDYF